MDRALISVRGYVEDPCLLEVDLRNGQLIQRIDFPLILPDSVEESKRGLAGLGWHQGVLYAATTDRILLLEPGTWKVLDTITDRRFSDLHSLHVDHNGTIWVTSSNIDGVYTVRNQAVEPYWHSWEADPTREVALDDDVDYRELTKLDTPFHKHHVNAVHAGPSRIFISFLGRAPRRRLWHRWLSKTGLLSLRARDGGIFVMDRSTKRVIQAIRMEGLHDLTLCPDGQLTSTQYFGQALVRLDPERLTVRTIPLEFGHWKETGYLTRGVLWQPDGYWVGHTRHRGWMQESQTALVRHYTHEGKWTGKQIALPGYCGVYEIIGFEPASVSRQDREPTNAAASVE